MLSDILIRVLLIVLPVASGSAIVWSARATASGRIKRNWAVGIRVTASMTSEEAWLACHIRAQRPMIAGGIAMMMAGLAGFLPLPLSVATTALGIGALAMLVCVSYAGVVGVRAAKAIGA